MRIAFVLLAIFAVCSCQTTRSGSGNEAWPSGRGMVASPAQVQSDVAAIIKGMDQARSDGLRRAESR